MNSPLISVNSLVSTKRDGFLLTLEGKKAFERPNIKYDSILEEKLEETMSLNHFQELFSVRNPEAQRKFDSNETIYIRDQFTYLIPKVMKYWKPDYTAEMAVPVSTEGGAYSEFIEYQEESWTGEAQPYGEEATDMPLVSYSTVPTMHPTIPLNLGWEYSWDALNKAISTGQPLSSKLAFAAKDGQDRANNAWALGLAKDKSGTFRTDPATASAGVCGVLSAPNIAKYITSSDTVNYTGVAASFDGSAIANFNMLGATGAQNRDFLLAVIAAQRNFTGTASAQPDTLYMSLPQVALIEKQVIDDANPNAQTVAAFILEKTSINMIIAAPELQAVGKNSVTDALLCYKRDPEIAEIRKVMPFFIMPTILTPQYRYRTGTKTRVAGFFVYKKAIVLVKNVGA